MQFSDKSWFVAAVVLYGISTVYSIGLYGKGFRRDNLINYGLLLAAFALHSASMFLRGFSLQRCPINNLYEATIFIDWTILTVYLPLGAWPRLRFLGAFAAPILFAVGVFALMPGLDVKGHTPTFTGGWSSLHKALILLAYGTFGLSSIAGFMYLAQEHDLKFHKMRAVFSRLPPIQRLERVLGQLMLVGLALLTAGILASLFYLKEVRGYYFASDALLFYSIFVWLVYCLLAVLRWGFDKRGRRLAWGAVLAFAFVMLTFWGIFLLSRLHASPGQPQPEQAWRARHLPPA